MNRFALDRARLASLLARLKTLPVPKSLPFISTGGSKTLTMTVEVGFVNLLACQGSQVVAYRRLMVNPQFFREGLPRRTDTMGGILRGALREMNVDHARVVGAIPGFQSTLQLWQYPKARGLRPEELIPREVARRGISSQSSYVSWHQVADQANRSRWLVAASARRSVSSFLDLAQHAGLAVKELDLRPFALARSVNQKDAVIAWVAFDGFDAVIVKESVPIWYECVNVETSPVDDSALVERLVEMVGRAIENQARGMTETVLPEEAPLCVCGPAAGLVPELGLQVAQNLQRPFLEFAPPVVYPEGFPVHDFAINLGLALREA